MAQKTGKGKGGRARLKMTKRATNKTTQKNKVVKVYRSSGMKAAVDYGSKHIVLTWFREEWLPKHAPNKKKAVRHD